LEKWAFWCSLVMRTMRYTVDFLRRSAILLLAEWMGRTAKGWVEKWVEKIFHHVLMA
jgi:hypothetical protein